MKKGEKLGTNEAGVEKHGQLGAPAERGAFPKSWVF